MFCNYGYFSSVMEILYAKILCYEFMNRVDEKSVRSVQTFLHKNLHLKFCDGNDWGGGK